MAFNHFTQTWHILLVPLICSGHVALTTLSFATNKNLQYLQQKDFVKSPSAKLQCTFNECSRILLLEAALHNRMFSYFIS